MNVEQWTPLVYRLARKYFKRNEQEIDDIVQDCLLKVVTAAPKYNSSKASEMTFAFQVISNYLRTEYRRQQRQRGRCRMVNAPVEIVEMGRPMEEDMVEVMQVVQVVTEDTSYRIRSAVRRTLMKKGWAQQRIDESFAKISDNLWTHNDRKAYIVSAESK